MFSSKDVVDQSDLEHKPGFYALNHDKHSSLLVLASLTKKKVLYHWHLGVYDTAVYGDNYFCIIAS